MQKKRSILLIGILIFICLFSGCAAKPSSPVLVERPNDVAIPIAGDSSTSVLDLDGVSQFSLKSASPSVLYMNDEFLIYSTSGAYELDGTSVSNHAYYQYFYDTKESVPLVATGVSDYYRLGNPSFVQDGDSLYFYLYNVGSNFLSDGKHHLYKLNLSTNELSLLGTDKNEPWERQLFVQDGKLYSLAEQKNFFSAKAEKFIEKIDPETGNRSKVLRESSLNGTICNVFQQNGEFILLMKDNKAETYRLDYYDADWKWNRTVSLAAHSVRFDEASVDLVGNWLCCQIDSRFYRIDLSSEGPKFETETDQSLICSAVCGEHPSTRLVVCWDSYTTYTDLLYGLTSDAEWVEYDFYPFTSPSFRCQMAVQSGDLVMISYTSPSYSGYYYILTDLATLESYKKK